MTSKTWEKYVYPKCFDALIHLKFQRLRTRRELLRRGLLKEHPPEQDLEIPKGDIYKLDEFPNPEGRVRLLLYGPDT